MRRISLERTNVSTNINCFEKRRRSMKLREQFSRVLKSLEDRRNEAEHGIREREKPVSRIILSLSFTQSLDSRDQEIFRTLEISRRAGIKKQGGGGEGCQTSTSTAKMSQCGCDASAAEPARRIEGTHPLRKNPRVSRSLCARFARGCVAIMQSGALARIGQPVKFEQRGRKRGKSR